MFHQMLNNRFYDENNIPHMVSIILVSKDNYSFYIEEFRKNKSKTSGKVLLHPVGGKVEDIDINPLETGFREFREEIGLSLENYTSYMKVKKICDYPLSGNFQGKVNRSYYLYVNMNHENILHVREDNTLVFFDEVLNEPIKKSEDVKGLVWLNNNRNLNSIKLDNQTSSLFDIMYYDRYIVKQKKK